MNTKTRKLTMVAMLCAVAELLLPVFLPFNLLKGSLNTALTLLIYKPVEVKEIEKLLAFPPNKCYNACDNME